MEENAEASDDITDYYGSLIIREGEDIMADSIVIKATENFVQEIMKTDIYNEYDFQKRKLKEQPELFEKVREFRQKNFAMQTADAQSDELLDKLEAVEREAEKLRENPLVDNFLSAELAFCRMMQEVNVRIMAGLDFE
ncbi:MAG: YlbF family regulator [Lachnospiraceae bacterium]|nr:YlbF family regulator [Lachnospiraceae bacterium]